MAGKIQHPAILTSWPLTVAALFMLLFGIPACAQVVHENPNALVTSSGQSLDDQLNALLVKMLGSLDDVSSALDQNNITATREAYSRLSSSFDGLDGLLWQLNLSESDYRSIAGQINLMNDEVMAIIDGSDAYSHGIDLYNDSLSGGDLSNASIAAAQVRDSYRNVSSSYGGLRQNVTAMESLLEGRNIDTGRLDSALASLDRHMYSMNRSYENLSIPENVSRLKLSVGRSNVSQGDYVLFSCSLIGPDGVPVSGANVSIFVDGLLAGNVVTDDRGEGSAGYRIPISVTGDRVLAHAEYVPAANPGPAVTSNYVELSIQDVPASLSARLDKASASFGDTVNVAGELTAGGSGMPYRQVWLSIGGSPVANASTDKNGFYAYALQIGPSMPAGASFFTAAYHRKANDILLNATSPDVPLNILQRSTALSLNSTGEAVSGGPYFIYGSLMADNGVPVSGANVSIYLDGSAAGGVTTGDDGKFTARIDLPNDSSQANHTVYASYDPGPGKALYASSSAQLLITVRQPGAPGDRTMLAIIGAVILLVVAAGVYIAWRRLSASRPKMPAIVNEMPVAVATEALQEPMPDIAVEAARIRALRDKNAREAMAYAYAVSRKALSTRVGLSESMTHHETYDAAVAALPSVSKPLNDIIAIYEKAVFANRPVDGADIDVAVGSLYALEKSLGDAGK